MVCLIYRMFPYFQFVLQSRNAYELDGEQFSVDDDDFNMEITGGKSNPLGE